MAGIPKELSISLEHLDDHLRAILKLKLREFVHLSPWFNNVPAIDSDNPASGKPVGKKLTLRLEDNCPHRKHKFVQRRRNTRLHMITPKPDLKQGRNK